MLQILLHSSKTMAVAQDHAPRSRPLFQTDASVLAQQLRTLHEDDLAEMMQISPAKASEVKKQYALWSTEQHAQSPAIDAFKGDIYSGLQVGLWTEADRVYAHDHLIILSGLYGALRACDGIMPYRLEMAYDLPDGTSLYSFWRDKLPSSIDPEASFVVNLSAVEYTKALLPYIDRPVIAPKFMTLSPKTNEPTFVTVHAKIARGAYARWLIQNRFDTTKELKKFDDLGYQFDAGLSTDDQPVFVCETFQGIGLSVRK